VRAAVQDAEMLDGLGVQRPARLHPHVRRLGRLAALAGILLAPIFTVYPQMGVE